MSTDPTMEKRPTSSKQNKNQTERSFPHLLVKVKKLKHFKGNLPEYQSAGASGFDIRACLKEDIMLSPGERTLIPTGLIFEIPPGFEMQSRPRSGLALRQGLTVLNSPGTIDSDYRGEIQILILNTSKKTIQIKDQERISQIVLCPVYRATFKEQGELNETQRGGEGFGSTGV